MPGQLAHWAQRRTGTLPPALGWGLLGLSAAGAVLMPVSGFWLVIPQAPLALALSRRGGAPEDAVGTATAGTALAQAKHGSPRAPEVTG